MNPILYIINRVGTPVNKYNILKILYFADQKCLVKYNKKVTEDWYEKKEYGPVAYHTYDLLKAVEGRNLFITAEELSSYIEKVGEHSFWALQEADFEEFTKVQMECLNESIDENAHLSFNELLDKSHDVAYHMTEELYQEIDKYDIALAGGAHPDQIAYMKEMDELMTAEWK